MKTRIHNSWKSWLITVMAALVLLGNQAWSAVYYWDPNGTTSTGGDGTWDTTTKEWSTTSTQSAAASLVAWNTANAACFFAGANASANQGAVNITVNSAITMGGIFNGNLNPGPCTATINGTGSLNVNSGINAAFATGGTGPPSGATIINIPITGAGAIVPQGGGGNLYLHATNTFTGGTLLGFTGLTWTSVLNFNSPNVFGTGNITLENSGTGTGALLYEGTDAITITNKVIVAAIGVAPPKLNIVGNPAGVTFSGTWTLNTNTVIGVGNAAANLAVISGVISGGFPLTKFNPGILELTATNTYTGATSVTNGILQLGDGVSRNGTVAGTITITTPGSLIWANPTALTYNKVISGIGAMLKTNAGVLTLSAVATYSGGTTIGVGSTLKVGIANALPQGTGKGDLQLDGTLDLGAFSCAVNGLNGAGVVDNSTGTATYTLTAGNNNANGAFSGIIKNTSGTVALTKAGSGVLNLTGVNTYAGATTISVGTIQLGINNALPAASSVIIAAGATLDTTGVNDTIAALSGAGMLNNNNGALVVNGSSNGPNGQNFNGYSCIVGTINGSGSLTKGGTHAMAVRGNNAFYGGSVILSGGTLSVGAGPDRLPTSLALTVPNGALFQLDGSSQTVATLNGNGSVNLGGGTLNIAQNGSDNFTGVIQNSELPGSSVALGHGLRGYYYTNIDFTGLSTVRDDATVNLPDMSALPGFVPGGKTNQISVRWVGQVLTTVAGDYVFSTRCDDGQRLWVNGQLMVDDWVGHGATTKSGTNTLAANTRYDIVMEYFNNTVGGSAQLLWAPPGDTSVVIPASNLFLPGAGTLVKSGGGSQQLSGVNTYTGGSIVSQGSLQASVGGALGGGNVTVADGASLEIDSNSAINSAADVVIGTAATGVNLNYSGADNVRALSLDGGATYQSAGTYGSSTSGAAHQLAVFSGNGVLNVAANPSANTLTSSSTLVVYGTSINFTSTITGPGGTPTGTVLFYDGANLLGSSPVTSGVATFSINNLMVGVSHSVTAAYGGDTTHASSTSTPISVTTTTATIVPNPVIANRTYDGTTNATIGSTTFGGIVDADTNYVHVAGTYTASFNDKNVGVNKPVSISGLVLTGSQSGNYVLSTTSVSTTGNITNKPVTISGITAPNRPYDSTTNETVSGTAALNASLIISPDLVTLSGSPTAGFTNKIVGTAKPVLIGGLTITGADASNYILVLTNLSANITAFAVSATGVTANNKTYDGGTVATLSGTPSFTPAAFAGDDVTLGGTPIANFNTAVVATGKPVTVTGFTLSGLDSTNYSLTQPAGLTANISQANTTATIASSVNPSMLTSNVTFKFTVTATTLTTNPPTGSVTFFTNSIAVSPTVALVSNTPTSSVASYTTALLPLGTSPVAVVYGGDVNFAAPLSPSLQQIVQNATCSQTNKILSIIHNGGTSYTLNFIGTPQATYYVVAQTNISQPFANWAVVAGSTNTVSDPNGLWSMTVTNPAPSFYRSVATLVCP